MNESNKIEEPMSTTVAPSDDNAASWRTAFTESDPVIQNCRYVTFLSCALTAVVVYGVVFGKVREEGVYADDYLWMRYQTLLTPAHYTKYVWFPLLILQALFIYGSVFTFKLSPLIGYSTLISSQENTADRTKTYINCPIIYYPGMCAMSIFMIYSYDHEYMLFATVFAALVTVISSKIILTQLSVLTNADNANNNVTENNGATLDKDRGEIDVTVVEPTSNPLSFGFLNEYVSLRLPFELFGGYSICLVFQYLNTWLHVFGLNPKALVITANISIITILMIAAYILWGLKQGNGRHLYGAAVSMVWFLVGIAIELQSPTQPIYNTFSDSQIMTTQILAGLASTLLTSLMAVRMVNSAIKRNMLNCIGACQGKNAEDVVEDVVITGYVHA